MSQKKRTKVLSPKRYDEEMNEESSSNEGSDNDLEHIIERESKKQSEYTSSYMNMNLVEFHNLSIKKQNNIYIFLKENYKEFIEKHLNDIDYVYEIFLYLDLEDEFIYLIRNYHSLINKQNLSRESLSPKLYNFALMNPNIFINPKINVLKAKNENEILNLFNEIVKIINNSDDDSANTRTFYKLIQKSYILVIEKLFVENIIPQEQYYLGLLISFILGNYKSFEYFLQKGPILNIPENTKEEMIINMNSANSLFMNFDNSPNEYMRLNFFSFCIEYFNSIPDKDDKPNDNLFSSVVDNELYHMGNIIYKQILTCLNLVLYYSVNLNLDKLQELYYILINLSKKQIYEKLKEEPIWFESYFNVYGKDLISIDHNIELDFIEYGNFPNGNEKGKCNLKIKCTTIDNRNPDIMLSYMFLIEEPHDNSIESSEILDDLISILIDENFLFNSNTKLVMIKIENVDLIYLYTYKEDKMFILSLEKYLNHISMQNGNRLHFELNDKYIISENVKNIINIYHI